MTEMHERLWHEWYDLWHEADASASKPSYEDWLEARIEELEKWGEAAEQALVYAATVTNNPMVDKVCMDRATEWAAFAAEKKT